MQRQGFSLIDQKLTKLQPSENGLNLRFRATEGTYLVECTSLLRNHVRAFILLYMQSTWYVDRQRPSFNLIDRKLPKLQPSENGIILRFRITEEGTLWSPLLY